MKRRRLWKRPKAIAPSVVNEAEGEASRFTAVLRNTKGPEVTRKRLYLETMEKVLGDVDKIILDENVNGRAGRCALSAAERIARSPAPEGQLMRKPLILSRSSSCWWRSCSSVFIVDEREKALVLQFGQIVASRKSRAWRSRSR